MAHALSPRRVRPRAERRRRGCHPRRRVRRGAHRRGAHRRGAPRHGSAMVDVPRVRADAAAPRLPTSGAPGILRAHVGSIPRESGGLSNGAGGCVGDVDGDGRRRSLLPRMSEPSELIRGRPLLARARAAPGARPRLRRDRPRRPGAEVVVLSNVGWTGESRVTVGRIVAAGASDDTPERYVCGASSPPSTTRARSGLSARRTPRRPTSTATGAPSSPSRGRTPRRTCGCGAPRARGG